MDFLPDPAPLIFAEISGRQRHGTPGSRKLSR